MSAIDWDAVYAAMGPRVRSVARAILRDQHEAEDAVQETFLRAFRSADSLRDAKALPGWLLMIARRAAINRGRKRGLEPHVAETVSETALDRREPLASDAVELSEAFARLTKSEQRALNHHASGLTMAQVAVLEGISVGAARTRLCRARAALRRMVLS